MTHLLQLTLSCGERQVPAKHVYPTQGYNSRSPVESDDDICEEDMRDIATTHALLLRATLPSGIYCLLFSGYNSRSSAESDPFHGLAFSVRDSYNSRSPAESDEVDVKILADNLSYNSRSPAESDLLVKRFVLW